MASHEVESLGSARSVEKLQELAAGRALNRRRFVTALGMTGAAASAGLMSGCSNGTVTASTSPSGSTTTSAQIDALVFALNLEYLEATFYAFITQGTDLSASLTASSGAVSGAPPKLTFTGTNAQQITDMLNEIYFDEVGHVTTLRNLLGSSGIARPALNLAAFGAISATNALSVARLLEDVGVTAYTGAAGSLGNSNLTFAAQILAVESFHSGALRLVSVQNPTLSAYVAADIQDVRPADPGSSVGTAGPTSAGSFFPTYGAAAVNTTAGMAFSRTASQVLAVLYGSAGASASAGASSGGFFPSGLNGNIKTV
jgi:hypothetical protein